MGRGDQYGALGGDEAAQHGAPGLHPFRGDDHVDVTGAGHQGEDRLGTGPRRHHLDVIDRRTRALGHAGHRRGLRPPTLAFGQGDDPVGQYATTLAAHGNDGDANRPVGRGRGARSSDLVHARSVRKYDAMGSAAVLEESDNGGAQPSHRPVEPSRIADDIGAIEGRAQHGGFGYFAAIAAADARFVDRRRPDRRARDRRCGLHRQRRAAREPDAGMVAGTDVFIHAETFLHHAQPFAWPLWRTRASRAVAC